MVNINYETHECQLRMKFMGRTRVRSNCNRTHTPGERGDEMVEVVGVGKRRRLSRDASAYPAATCTNLLPPTWRESAVATLVPCTHAVVSLGSRRM